jgi:hypothetical protein
LSADEAERLSRNLNARPASPAPWDADLVDQAEARLAAQLDNSVASLPVTTKVFRPSTAELKQQIKVDLNALLATLDHAELRLGASAESDSLTREVSDYFWVDYRPGPSSSWRSVHPAYGNSPWPDVHAHTTYDGSIPEELTHRVRIELIVDQRLGSTIKSAALMSPIEFPSANVSGKSMSLMLVPDTMLRKNPFDNVESLAEQTHFLIPLLNGGLPKGARALALNGTTVPPEAISVSATGIFETVGNEFASAASALNRLGSDTQEDTDLVTINSVRLLVTIIQPSAEDRTIERILYHAADKAGAIANNEDDMTLRRIRLVQELARSHKFAFVAGSLLASYVLDQTLEDLAQQAPLFRAWSNPELAGCLSLDCLPIPDIDLAPSGANAATVFAEFDQHLPIEAKSIIYRDAINVVRLSEPLLPGNASTAGVFDIIYNQRRAYRLGNGSPQYAPDLIVASGIWETYLERYSEGLGGSGSALDTISVAKAERRKLSVWTREQLAELPASANIEKRMMEQALQAGMIVVTIPLDMTRSDALFGWWEVNPVTGSTIGMTRNGGAVLIAYIGGLTIGGTVVGVYVAQRVARVRECWQNRTGQSDGWDMDSPPPDGGPVARATLGACVTCTNASTLFRGFQRGIAAVWGGTISDDSLELMQREYTFAQIGCLVEVNGYRSEP